MWVPYCNSVWNHWNIFAIRDVTLFCGHVVVVLSSVWVDPKALSPLSCHDTAPAFLVSFACVSAGYIQCWSNLALGSHRSPHNPRHLLCQSLERADKSSQAIRVLALEYSAPTMNICIVWTLKRSSLIALIHELLLILNDSTLIPDISSLPYFLFNASTLLTIVASLVQFGENKEMFR